MATKAQVAAWLDAKGWPHDTRELGKARLNELRRELRICGHRTRDGTPCSFIPMANGRCKRAGGTARRGVSHPQFVHGGRSRYVPKALRADHKATLQRIDEAMRMEDEIALLIARRKDLLRRSGDVDLKGAWKRAQAELAGLQLAGRRDDQAAVTRHVQALEKLLGAGATEAEAWDGVLAVIEQTRRVVETKVRAADKSRESLRLEVALAFYRGLTFAVREAVAASEIPERQRQFILDHVAEAFGKRLANSGMAQLAEQSNRGRSMDE